MPTKAGLEHIQKRIDNITSATELRRWWECDIGREYQHDPQVIAMKDRRKQELANGRNKADQVGGK